MNLSFLKSPKNFAALDEDFSSFETSKFVVLPVEYEGTVSYGKGTLRGPGAIIDASRFLEWYDYEFESEPARCGVSTLAPLCFSKDTPPEQVVSEVEKQVSFLLENKKVPVVLGGEHSVSIGAVRASHAVYAADSLSVLHIDAHADLREEYEFSHFSHACALKRIRDCCKNTVSLGVRSLSREEHDLIKKESLPVFFQKDVEKEGLESVVERVISSLSENVYVSLDLDCLDSSVMPAVGTPGPGGLFFSQVAEVLKAVGQKKRIIAGDVVELSPIAGFKAPDYLAAKLAYRLMAACSAKF
ncbi:MAG: agmatinase [Candidatus Micrarchaeia archaeon]